MASNPEKPAKKLVKGNEGSEETPEAVENFIFEVSAGKSSGSRGPGKGAIGKTPPVESPAGVGPGENPAARSTSVQRPDAMLDAAVQPDQPAAHREKPGDHSAAPAKQSQSARKDRGPGQASRRSQLGRPSPAIPPKQDRPKHGDKRMRVSDHRADSARVVVTRVPETPKIRARLDTVRHAFRNMPSLGVSLMVHAVVLLLLSFYTLANLQSEDDLDLYSSAPISEETVDFSEIEIDPTDDLEELSEDFSAELLDPGQQSFGELSADSAMADLPGEPSMAETNLEEVGNLFDDSGQGLSDLGLSDLGTGKGGANVSFFGTRVRAKRILFLLDNSGSMRGGRLETMIHEMTRSVEKLTPKQHFYVLFYSNTVYPLFYPQPATQFVRATDKNKRLLIQWLATVELYSGNAVDDAIQAATATRPDVVYFLTDGDVNTTPDGRKLNVLLDAQGRTFSIHTFGMGAGTEGEFAENLVRIAKANGGTYRPVDVTPRMQELAKKKPRKYHKGK